VNAMKRAPRRATKPILWIAILALSAGCVAQPVRKVAGNSASAPPWRIAVLPAQIGEKEKREAAGKINEKMAERRAILDEIRTCMALHVPGDSYEVIPLPLVDRVVPPGTVLSPGPKAITAAARALHADLVLVPEIYSWRRRYYLVHGVSRVGITARIYDGATGKLLFESMHEQVRNQGALKIPAAAGGAVGGPIVGLQHIYMADMCRNVSGKIGEDMRALHEANP